jgi:hypothetical protein
MFQFFLAAVSMSYELRKKNKNTQIVPGTKSGVFWYIIFKVLIVSHFELLRPALILVKFKKKTME